MFQTTCINGFMAEPSYLWLRPNVLANQQSSELRQPHFVFRQRAHQFAKSSLLGLQYEDDSRGSLLVCRMAASFCDSALALNESNLLQVGGSDGCRTGASNIFMRNNSQLDDRRDPYFRKWRSWQLRRLFALHSKNVDYRTASGLAYITRVSW